MSNLQPHTPTTETVRSRYEAGRLALDRADTAQLTPTERSAEFARWYRAEIAAAEQRGAIKALRDAAEDLFYDGDTDRPLPGHSDLLDRADQEGAQDG